MEGQKDAAQIAPLKERIQHNYPGRKINSHSFDKGFYSMNNPPALQDDYTAQIELLKRGRHKIKKTTKEKSSKTFKS